MHVIVYPVELLHTGTACINISGDVLPHWLVATTALLIIELVAECFDAFLLIIINASRGWGNFKFKRPWCSMFLGIGVWIFIFGYGIFRTKIYPLQNHQVVIANNTSPCWVTLNPAGLRGELISWSDGIFYFMRLEYTGPAGY